GMILFFIFGFMWIDLKFNWNLIFLKIYGRYSLLAFLGVGMLFFILTQFFEPDLGMGPWGTLVTEFILFSISGIFLTVVYRKKLKISTEKVTITYIIIGSVLLLISSVN
ncbi:MAG: hypothetical protein KAT05_00815, partial [Spirochaetes bacterium]|nr:hypothetical protein [Spirochaetota bacterium]